MNDDTISRRHLRIYAINFDDAKDEIAPLVYAQDLSRNGTRLIRPEDVLDPGLNSSTKLLGMTDQPVLLNNNDELHVSPTVFFRFQVPEPTKVPLFATDALRVREREERLL